MMSIKPKHVAANQEWNAW